MQINRLCPCGFRSIALQRHIHFINVSTGISNQPQHIIPFNQLLVDQNTLTCENCNTQNEHSINNTYNIPDENRYIIINIHNTNMFVDNFKHVMISQYDPDNMLIPTSNGHVNSSYHIKSIIVRYGETANGGHYISWVRSIFDNSWLRCNDSNIRKYPKLINNLKDATLIFLGTFKP